MSKVTRIGLINFWLYDDEEFDFYDGKLLLRGSNGTGKSVTMQSFIPVILDGNKSPARLDPFGGTDKHMEAYLLGGIDSEQKEEATAYLYMEVYFTEKEKYVTIGMGLHAKKGRPIDFWGFALQDGRRIGKDIFLYKNHQEKIPLTKNELKAILGTENILVETTKDYKKMVNNLLFGFPTLDSYDEFINVLLQLRSPKLSKDYKPTKLMNILNSVLQPLSDEDLRPLSDAIEEMDKTKETIESLENDIKNISYLLKSYNAYNETHLYRKAFNYLTRYKEKNDIFKTKKQYEENLKIKQVQLTEERKKLEELQIEFNRFQRQKENLNSKDLEYRIARLQNLKDYCQKQELQKESLLENIENKKSKNIDLKNEIKKAIDEINKIKKECSEIKEEINDLCQQIKFNEPSIALKDLKENIAAPIDFANLNLRTTIYQNKLKKLKEKLDVKTKFEEQLNNEQVEYDYLTKTYNQKNDDLEQILENQNQILRDLKDNILLLNKKNQFLKLNLDEQNEIFNYLKNYQIDNYNKAKNIYEHLGQKFYDTSLKESYELQNKINRQGEIVTEIKNTLEQLKNNPEEELEITDEEMETNNYLKENNIPYAYFYKVIDFKDDLSEVIKDKLEAILISSGLLGAKIILYKDRDKLIGHSGTFLCATKEKKHNLSKYFKPVSNNQIPSEEINKVLKSISINPEDDIYIYEDLFQMDTLVGFAKERKARYIGILKRQNARKMKIEKTIKELQVEESILNNLTNLYDKKQLSLEIIKQEIALFPSNEKLQIFENQKLEINLKIKDVLEKKAIKEKTIQELVTKIEVIFKELINLKQDINLPLQLDSIEEAIEGTNYLINRLNDLKNTILTYLTKQETINFKQEQIEEIQNDISFIIADLNELEIETKKNQKEIEDLEAILNTDEYRQLADVLEKIEQKLTEIPKQKEQIQKNTGSLEAEINNLNDNINTILQKEETATKLLQLHEKFLLQEYNLGYVKINSDNNSYNLAKKILEQLSNRKDADIGNITSNFVEAYTKYKLELNNYQLKRVTIFNENDDDEYKQYYESNQRDDFQTLYRGKPLNIFQLQEVLEEAKEENNLIMNEQDRRLFEEILLKTIGDKIKNRIKNSKEWVKQINQIMIDMQKGSALSFNLEWRNKEAYDMDELDTKELVRIFQMEPNLIKLEDSNKLIKHFRSKLKKAIEYSKDTLSYANIIFDVLDYRNWFEFKMTYQRNGENKRELTDKVFAVFSGGEKAKTMYIPLFAAVSAKLIDANENALRLVALDEAFAGVDELNIREMFGIMNSLELDYILTSQSLWGDYDVIKDLAIANLIRPKNSQVVGVQRYRWNGKERQIILDKEINHDAITIF